MNYNSKFEDEELGNKFIEMGNKFLAYAQNNKTVLDFKRSWVEKDPVCGTVACHGGHACIIFGLDISRFSYDAGADTIAEFLGFSDSSNYLNWAGQNLELWGNDYGCRMFNAYGYEAFGFEEKGKCTLVDIGNWYVAVGNRILKKDEQ